MNLNWSHKIVLAALLAVQSVAAVAQTTNAPAPADYAKFIAQRNIFDPSRQPNVPFNPRPRTAYTPPVVRQVDAFSLVGIVGYGEGRRAGVYAFFDGTSAEYSKTAQLDDTIASFKITAIAADSVTLMSGTNGAIVMRIGEQLHNDGVGHWLAVNGMSTSYNSTGGYTSERNGGRNGYGNRGGGRRNNNYGNRNNGNYNTGGFNNRNFNTGGNGFAGSAAASDNLQQGDPNMNYQNDNASTNDGIVPDTGAQDDTTAPQTDQPQDASGVPTGPNSTLQQLQQRRAQELQLTGQ